MKRNAALILFSSLFLFFVTFVIQAFPAHAQTITPPAATDEIIVKYKDTTSDQDKQKLHAQNKTYRKHRIDKLHMEVVAVPAGTRDEKLKAFRNSKLVKYAEPNFKAQAFGISNDTALPQQWGLFKIDAANLATTSAWDITAGDASVKVAILDSGIDATHDDLAGKVVGSANFTTSPTLNDNVGHGTHVAGIAAAATNNAIGVAGTGYNTDLLNGKVLDDTGSGYYSWIANGIVWAADNGAKVISMSLGGSASSQALQDAVNYAWGKGVVIVAAAGNSNSNVPMYPGAYTNVVAVAATDTNDIRASFSNYGNWVDVAAPGVSIYSTYKGNSYATLSGTSMATPFAAGTAALIWAKGICSTNTCVRSQLEQTADKIQGTGSYWTWGRINAYNAVNEIVPSPTPTNTPSPTNPPTPTATASPTPVKTMTVSSIVMTKTAYFGGINRITSTITITDESTNAALPAVGVKGTVTSPSGIVSTFSGSTGTNGKISVLLNSREKGTFTTKITSVSKASFTYHPTVTTQTLLVQ
jgi:thermitase